jgi:hypothetical protein
MWHESHDLAIAYRVHSFEVPTWMLWVHRPHEEELPDSTWSWRLEALQTGPTRVVQPRPDGSRRASGSPRVRRSAAELAAERGPARPTPPSDQRA